MKRDKDFDIITEPQEWIDGLLKVYAPHSEDIDVALQNMGLRIKELEENNRNVVLDEAKAVVLEEMGDNRMSEYVIEAIEAKKVK